MLIWQRTFYDFGELGLKQKLTPFGNKFQAGLFYLSRKFQLAAAKRIFAFFKNAAANTGSDFFCLAAAIFRLRDLNRSLKLRLRSGQASAVTMIFTACLLLGTVPDIVYAINYSTATDTSDTDFDAGLVKSSVTVVDSGDAAYVEVSTTTKTGPNAFGFEEGGVWTWEAQVNGGALFLKVEGFSTAVDAKYFVDDIQVNQ